MPRLTIKLKQNTPMIHFQADKACATLRATAVKPALDRFLLAIYNEKAEAWMHDKTNKAFDYRMTFRATNVKIENSKLKKINDNGNTKYLPYFAPSAGIMSSQDVTMTIISENNDLVNAIKENITAFFLFNNFGTRATKGYGSFQVCSINNETVSYNEEFIKEKAAAVIKKLSEEFEEAVYKLPNSYNTWQEALAAVNRTYSIMKSGINRGKNNYNPAILSKKYRCGKYNFSGEKWWIKNKFADIKSYAERCEYRPDAKKDDKEREARFLRGMLGLPDSYKFDFIGRGFRYIVNVSDDGDNNNTIKRFASPLIFKPICIGNDIYVYILLKKIPCVMYDRKFKFTYRGVSGVLKTPSDKEFSLADFMKCVADNHFIQKVWDGGEAE